MMNGFMKFQYLKIKNRMLKFSLTFLLSFIGNI
jgi:hypothetical protein